MQCGGLFAVGSIFAPPCPGRTPGLADYWLDCWYTFLWAAFVWREASFDWFQLRQMGFVMNGLGRAPWTCLGDGIGTLSNDIWRMVDDGLGSDGSVAAGVRPIRSRYHQILELLASMVSSK